MFITHKIEQENVYDELEKSCVFEQIGKGRKVAILVDASSNSIPIVRTTTKYESPAQKFSQIHLNLIEKIRLVSAIPELKFNNALIEIYDNSYFKMGFHSDQALDLEKNTFICLFTCYKKLTKNLRTLRIKRKIGNEAINNFDIYLENNSFVIFSQ